MIETFEQILAENNILHPQTHIVVGVSGGVDSVVLLHLLQTIDEKKRPRISIAHVNHQLRDEANDEEEFVRELASTYTLPFYSITWPKEEHPESGIEEAARNVRYTFFKELMNEKKNTVLMTAHHQDDQVETVLMKLARGSSLEQLTGIKRIQPFAKGHLMRPLLDFPKEKIYEYAKKHNITYIEDASNQSLDYTRNRYRNQIIPLIQEENIQLNEHIEQFMQDIKDALAIASRPINKQFQKKVQVGSNQFSFDYKDFLKLEEPMQRALLKKLFIQLYQDSKTQYKTTYIEMIRTWLREGKVNTHLDLLNGFTVYKDYQDVFFSQKKQQSTQLDTEQFTLNKINQWVALSANETIGIFEWDGKNREDENTLVFHPNKVKLPLTIRHRKPGDRMRYKGLTGRKKIKDIFIDEKVSPKEREKAWMVEAADGQILWLISYRKMDLLSDRETDKIAYVIKYKKN